MSETAELTIDGRTIGAGHRTLVIAEIGVNHDGSAQRAMELVRLAASCGADAIKLQFFHASSLLHASAHLAEYQRERTRAETPFDLLKRYELGTEDLRRIVGLARELKLIPIATPFSPVDVETVEQFRLPAVKIASPDLVNRPLLSRTARLGKPLLLSTGAATLDEVRTTVQWLRGWNVPFALLHCISSYPTPAEHANLCWIGELQRSVGVPVGYSDHTTETLSGALAVAAGACIVERHLTHDRSAKGPDHAASSDPAQFARYVRHVREADVMRGCPGKQVLPIEEDVRRGSRQSLVIRRSLAAGEFLREEDLTVQRPGTGMPAAMIDAAVGRRIARPLTAGSLLQWDMLDEAA